ncbi:MAG: hypothetical protein WDW38_009539 [Sanguina aurantia]
MIRRFLQCVLFVTTLSSGLATRLLSADLAKVSPPVFPTRYNAKYTISMPHLYLTQPNGLKYPVEIWYDGATGDLRTDSYDGRDSVLAVGDAEFSIYPRLDRLECSAFIPGPVRSSSSSSSNSYYDPLFPDLSTWDFVGLVPLAGKSTQMWQSQRKQGDKVSQYSFYVTPEGVPVKFIMLGVNFLTDSHFDEYLYEFTSFTTKFDDAGVFDVPAVCKDSASLSHVAYRHPVARQHAALLPDTEAADDRESAEPTNHDYAKGQNTTNRNLKQLWNALRADERAYHIFAKAHDRVHASEEELLERTEAFKSATNLIRDHNAGGGEKQAPRFTMRVNKFADWTNEEFISTMLPNKARKAQQQLEAGEGAEGVGVVGRVGTDARREGGVEQSRGASFKPLHHFKGSMKEHQLPRHVDWRGTGADPGMKDQGMCGSCFVIDCSWDFGPNGCSGGDYQPVFNYVATTGGIALEQEYPYQGANDYCRAAIPPAGMCTAESFRYYSEGVYYNSECSTKSRDLDHAVVLFGYGTTDDGEDYWLVRNTWAKFYGDDGYLKMPRGSHDCGISSDPAVAVVNEKYVVAGKREAAMLETCVRLADMVQLLQDLAIEKVQANEEEGAKAVLQEKASIQDILAKSEVRARNNYALAAKLAQKIGEKQNEMLAYVRRANVSGTAPRYEPPRAQPNSYSPPPPPSRPKQDYSGSRSSDREESSDSRRSSSSGGSRDSSSRGYSSGAGDDEGSPSSSRREGQGGFDFGFKNGSGSNDWMSGGGGMGMPSWQKGMADAAARVKDAESNANSLGWRAMLSAEASIADAKARLKQRESKEDILDASSRLRRGTEDSMSEARERLRQQDLKIIKNCRAIVARYRRGDYVSEQELEYAFRELETRMM